MMVTKQIQIAVLGKVSEALAIAAINKAVRSSDIPKVEPVRDLNIVIGEHSLHIDCNPSAHGNSYTVWEYEK